MCTHSFFYPFLFELARYSARSPSSAVLRALESLSLIF